MIQSKYYNKQLRMMDDLRWKISEACFKAVDCSNHGLKAKDIMKDLERLSRVVDDRVYEMCKVKGEKYDG